MRLKAGQSVSWRGVYGRVYRGTVKSTANANAVQVVSSDGFTWLLPVTELDLTSDWRNVS